MPEPAISYARSGDVHIAYRVFGEGPLDLMVVAGFVSHLEVLVEEPGFERFVTRLASFARVIAFDRRGMGLSDRDAGISTLEDTATDMRAVLDHAGIERAAILGVSEGGPASALFAATYPDRTTALILWGSYARIAAAPDYPIGIEPAVLDGMIASLHDDWGRPAAIEAFAPSRAHDERFREWWARLLRMGTSPAGIRALITRYHELDARHVLPFIRVPALVLNRRDDRVAPRRWSRYLAENIPGARHVQLPGEDHLPWTQDPDAVLGEIEEFLTGTRTYPEPDRVLATVMFTDIVGSASHAVQLGDTRWRELLARHDTISRRALERYAGREIKQTGDGFLATFDGPARALRCARSIVEAASGIGLEVRAGLHTGEVEVVGADITGIAVTIASRIADEAEPGEVLTSQTVRDLVVGSGIAFAERGARALKGIPDEWRIYAVKEGA